VTRRRLLLGSVALLAGLARCGSPAPAPPPKAAAPAPPPAPPVAPPTPAPTPPPPKYEAKGRRDPFETLETSEASGGLTVASTKLTGIVRGTRSTLALVETPDGIGYILKPGDTLGDGRLLEIGTDSVVFQVAAKRGTPATRVVLKLVN
jgi:Tfp pilus assembly protein PilP